MMKDEKKGGVKMANKTVTNNTARPIAIMLTIIALLAGMAAIIRPLQQQIHALSAELRNHINQNNHPWGVIAEVAELRQKFVEVETQFNGVRDVIEMVNAREDARIEKLEEWQRWWRRNVPTMDATQNEKLSQLEEKIRTLEEGQ